MLILDKCENFGLKSECYVCEISRRTYILFENERENLYHNKTGEIHLMMGKSESHQGNFLYKEKREESR